MSSDWTLYSFVVRGKHRLPILQRLAKGACQPSDLVGVLEGVNESAEMSTVSRDLKELVTRGLVELLTPNQVRGRIYTITDTGVRVLRMVDAQQPS